MKNKRFIFLLLFIIRSVWIFACMNSLVLSEGNFRIVVSNGELPPIKLAVATLQRDFKSVMGVLLLFLFRLIEKREVSN